MDEYILNYGGILKFNVNLLVNDSDDGDGLISIVVVEYQCLVFYCDVNGKDFVICIVCQDVGINIKLECIGFCLGEYEKYVCYGGNIEVEVCNNFSLFFYEIEYVIYDVEVEEFKFVMMYFMNIVKNINMEVSGGGGGLMGSVGVFGLLLLVWFR